FLEIVADPQERAAKRLDVVDQLLRQVPVNAADPEKRGMHAASGGPFIEYHQLLALLEAPQRRRQRTHVHGLGGDVEEMRQQPPDLRVDPPNERRPPWNDEAKQLFRREAERMLLIHRRDVVEAVEIGDRLLIGLVFDELFGAAMEEADVRVDAIDHL